MPEVITTERTAVLRRITDMKKNNKLLAAVIASLLILPSCKTPGQTTDETNETGKAPITSVTHGTS